jgi:hypothetical protein
MVSLLGSCWRPIPSSVPCAAASTPRCAPRWRRDRTSTQRGHGEKLTTASWRCNSGPVTHLGIPRAGEASIPRGRDDLGERKADADVMEFIGHEIIALLTSAVVLLGAAAIGLALLSGLAAEVQLHIEDLSHDWKTRYLKSGPRAPRSRTQVAAELGIDQ